MRHTIVTCGALAVWCLITPAQAATALPTCEQFWTAAENFDSYEQEIEGDSPCEDFADYCIHQAQCSGQTVYKIRIGPDEFLGDGTEDCESHADMVYVTQEPGDQESGMVTYCIYQAQASPDYNQNNQFCWTQPIGAAPTVPDDVCRAFADEIGGYDKCSSYDDETGPVCGISSVQ